MLANINVTPLCLAAQIDSSLYTQGGYDECEIPRGSGVDL